MMLNEDGTVTCICHEHNPACICCEEGRRKLKELEDKDGQRQTLNKSTSTPR